MDNSDVTKISKKIINEITLFRKELSDILATRIIDRVFDKDDCAPTLYDELKQVIENHVQLSIF
jgi:cytolysin (calcineurin-like family phosphatase)